MAQQNMQIEMVEVKSEDIIAERRALYDNFMGATVWATAGVVGLLAALWLFFG